jgi:hypothetical protein
MILGASWVAHAVQLIAQQFKYRSCRVTELFSVMHAQLTLTATMIMIHEDTHESVLLGVGYLVLH